MSAQIEWPIFPNVTIHAGTDDVLDRLEQAIRDTLPIGNSGNVLKERWDNEQSHLDISVVGSLGFFDGTEKYIRENLPIRLERPAFKDALVSLGFPFLRADLILPHRYQETSAAVGVVQNALRRNHLSVATLRPREQTADEQAEDKVTSPRLMIETLGLYANGVYEISTEIDKIGRPRAA